MENIILEGFIDPMEVETEDGGASKIILIGADIEDEGMFIELKSWDERIWEGKDTPEIHKDFKSLVGKKVRVTIEIIE